MYMFLTNMTPAVTWPWFACIYYEVYGVHLEFRVFMALFHTPPLRSHILHALIRRVRHVVKDAHVYFKFPNNPHTVGIDAMH